MSNPKITEGPIPFVVQGETHSTWYKLVGDLTSGSRRPPLVVLHGGPGFSHDYLLPLIDLVSLDPSTTIIFYDQLGSCRSTNLPDKDPSFWTIDLFISELENLLSYLGITESFDLLGHSWGGVLAAEFIVRRAPRGLRRLVLANTLASAKLRNEAVKRLCTTLPEDVQEKIRTHEQAGTTDAPEYKQAMFSFYAKFACRVEPFPEQVVYSIQQSDLAGGSVLKGIMKNGFDKEWDITDRIHLIRVPTLLVSGEYDYMAEEACLPFFRGIEKIKWVKFAQSSHTPHVEERERYMKVLNSFLLDD
ncbi:hypothetical protein M0805_007496 [Coniferiporia weirii]|nr:hypothetical protein M0805_007496 [Coniferiporia weirii]